MLEQSIIYNEICKYIKSGPAGIVIFGASGDLTKRKPCKKNKTLIDCSTEHTKFFPILFQVS